MKQTLERVFPLFGRMKNYSKADLRGDATAGLTTAVMLVPQAMAYAMLAGLPPIVGLYASIVPLALYGLLGTSRELAVGPVAMVSLLVASGVGALATGPEQFVALAVVLALMVGVLQLGMGLFRLGFLVNFLSHPVISGFSSAAALIIGLSQLKHLMGVSLPRSSNIFTVLTEAAGKLGEINVLTLAIGLGSVALLVGLKKWKPMFPRALAVVVVGTLLVWGLGLDAQGVSVVGDVPAGLPGVAVPEWSWTQVQDLMPIALTIALVGFMESISVARSLANKNRYEVDANQELVALGAANIGGSFFGAYPVTGGFSRTAVNAQAGSKSGLSSIITAVFVALVLLFLTPLFTFLPKAVLAAIIMTAVFGLIDVKEVQHLWKVKRSDLALLGITFVATLALGIEEGILTGVGASLMWFVIRSTRPHTAVLGRLPGTTDYRNVANYPEAIAEPGVLALRVDAQFYFGNVTFLKETLSRLEREARPPVLAVVLDASSINQLDASADEALHQIAEDYKRRGVYFALAAVKSPVREVMRLSGLEDLVGQSHFFLNVHDAVTAALHAGRDHLVERDGSDLDQTHSDELLDGGREDSELVELRP